MEGNAWRGASQSVLLTKYPDDQIKRNQMGGVCGTNRGSAYRNLAGNMKVRDRTEELGGNRRIILKWIIRKLDGVRGLDVTGSE